MKENKIEEEKKEQKEKEESNKNIIVDNNIDSDRKITDDINKDAPTLLIEEVECNLLNGQKIKVNAQGMIGGRGNNDGVVIFGAKTNKEQDEKIKSDFILNCDNKTSYPCVFFIYFEKAQKSYYIKPYTIESDEKNFFYIKLNHDNNYPLRQKEIILAGNIIFHISPLEDNKLEIVNLSKKNSEDEQKKIFDPKEIKEISIGRDKNCTFAFPKDKSFSRCQTTFLFDEKTNEWTIIDGSKTKSSTNGTWIFGTHSFEIKDQLIVEILNSKFSFSVRTQSNQ